MAENRYAILIGMDNYSTNPLPYCVKDVNNLEEVLVSKCRFNKENIYKIVDSSKAVKELIDEAYSSIERTFIKNQDLLFFYFSGHGFYDKHEEKSKVLFEDNTELTIEDLLLRYFLKIAPKNQYLLIDACHAGSKIHFKGDNPEKEIRRLNHNSSELCLMFATESMKVAIQGHDIENSYFTHFFIEALNKDTLYDEDGFLTIQAIDNYIKKSVVGKSSFLQIPVSEIRGSGYKPFAFNEDFISKKISKDKNESTSLKGNTIDSVAEKIEEVVDVITFEDSLSLSYRNKVQEKVVSIIDKNLGLIFESIDGNVHEVFLEDPFYELEYGNQEKIHKAIIKLSNKEEIKPFEGVFEIEHIEKKPPNFLSGISSIASLLFENSKPEVRYKIYTGSSSVYCNGIRVKAKNIYQCSCGLIILFYQAKYGYAIATVKYSYIWGGTKEDVIGNPILSVGSFLLNEDVDKNVNEFLTKNIKDFTSNITFGDSLRKSEIEKFIKKASKISNII